MSDRLRTQSGKFAAKSDEPRKVRSLRLTDSVWEKLEQLANEKSTSERRITRADLIEEWMQNDQVLHGQLELFESIEPKQSKEIDKKFQDHLKDVFFDAFGQGRQSKYGKAAGKALNKMLKVLQEEMG